MEKVKSHRHDQRRRLGSHATMPVLSGPRPSSPIDTPLRVELPLEQREVDKLNPIGLALHDALEAAQRSKRDEPGVMRLRCVWCRAGEQLELPVTVRRRASLRKVIRRGWKPTAVDTPIVYQPKTETPAICPRCATFYHRAGKELLKMVEPMKYENVPSDHRSNIMMALVSYVDESKLVYQNGATDRSIAEELGYPMAEVIAMRLFIYPKMSVGEETIRDDVLRQQLDHVNALFQQHKSSVAGRIAEAIEASREDFNKEHERHTQALVGIEQKLTKRMQAVEAFAREEAGRLEGLIRAWGDRTDKKKPNGRA